MKQSDLKDDLTGLFNRTYLSERIVSEFERANRYVFSLSVVILEVDSATEILSGHPKEMADKMLREIAEFLAGFARRNDVLVRGDNNEFIFILPDTRKKGAATFGARLCEVFKEHTFHLEGSKADLTASVGLANFPEDGVKTSDALLDLAERALKQAKEDGGDRSFAFKSMSTDQFKDIVRKEEEQSLAELKENVSHMVKKTNQGLLKFLEAYAKSMASKDAYSRDHVENVKKLAEAIAREMNLSGDRIEDIKLAALLCRLGKAGIEKDILQKQNSLNERELEKMRAYPKLSADILSLVHFLSDVVPIVLSHREWYDGRGYPEGLSGEKIPVGARILSLADSFEALLSDRPYRKAYSVEKAIAIIRESAGSQFDPNIVTTLMKLESVIKSKRGTDV